MSDEPEIPLKELLSVTDGNLASHMAALIALAPAAAIAAECDETRRQRTPGSDESSASASLRGVSSSSPTTRSGSRPGNPTPDYVRCRFTRTTARGATRTYA